MLALSPLWLGEKVKGKIINKASHYKQNVKNNCWNISYDKELPLSELHRDITEELAFAQGVLIELDADLWGQCDK